MSSKSNGVRQISPTAAEEAMDSSGYADLPKDDARMEVDEEVAPCTKSVTDRVFAPPSSRQTFQHLVIAYGEHQRMMQLSFSTEEQFMDEHKKGKRLREMIPSDVGRLAAVELTGLMYWIEKQYPFVELEMEDKATILKRYSVRKLSLDHFYSASKHPERCKNRDFVMNNYTYVPRRDDAICFQACRFWKCGTATASFAASLVPRNRTGFELPEDDNLQIDAKRLIFKYTYDYFWRNVIDRFVEMKVNDAEIVFLHIMLLWSVADTEELSEGTIQIMIQQREWALEQLHNWYIEQGVENFELRYAHIILLLGEIEFIVNKHCQDFQVAKMFEFCDMSMFWYEKLCYTESNTDPLCNDFDIIEGLRKLIAKEMAGAEKRNPFEAADIPTRMYSNFEIKPIDPSLQNIEPAQLVFRPEMLPSVMAPLPDDFPLPDTI